MRGAEVGRELLERLRLLLERANATDPEVLRIGGRKIAARRLEQRRNGADLQRQLAGLVRRERRHLVENGPRPDGIVIQLDGAVNDRPFLRRRIAFGADDRRVVRRVARERLEHAQVVVHAVQFGADQVVIDLLRDRPAGGVDRLEPTLQPPQSDRAGAR